MKNNDIKEKLVELLDNFPRDLSPFAGNEKLFAVDDNVEQAEYLIAHGVTVQENCKACAEATQNCIVKLQEQIAELRSAQEWISQAELPWMGEEIAILCIRYMEEYADFHGYASSKKVKEHIVRLLELEKDGRIAVLPQPPKGARE